MKNERGITLIKLILIIIVVGIALVFGVAILSALNYDYPEPQSKYDTIYNIGDTITTSKYEITVKNIEERTKVGIPKYYKTVDDYYYTLVCATIEMKNITNEPQRIYDYRPDFSIYFKLEDDVENIYYNDSEFTTYYQYEFDNFNYSEFTINPGETATVTPVFKMDKSKYQNRDFYLNILGNTALVKIK